MVSMPLYSATEPVAPTLAAGSLPDNVVWTARLPYGMKHRAVRRLATTPITGMVHRRQLNTSYSPNVPSGKTRQDYRVWEINWDGMKPSEATEIEALYLAAYCGGLLVDFTPPDEETDDVAATVPCYIVSKSLKLARQSAGRYSASIALREAL